ncbi:hypothetical protein AVEN_22673-1 [Araneus ventricosus]|uniref:Integrase catalytic domain-containing protein n=1 Tax=Araneus ventricosus TaxID=182803 RepID=A0A4Y2W322_ARAVE|nr:hypothetical protein AVEN_22673-1 [Araneus ventricosus]
MFVYMLLQKLDASSKLWVEREFNKSKEIPSLKELLDFLKNYARTSQSSRTSTNLKRNVYSKNTSLVISNVKNSKPKCAFCNNDNHAIYKCEEFLKLSVDDKVLFLKQKSLCFNCFKGHNVRICNSKGNCKKCFKRHNTLIHFDEGRNATSFGTTSVNIKDEVNLEPSQQVSNHSSLNPAAKTFQVFPNNDPSFGSPLLLGERSSYNDSEKCVLLSTATLLISNSEGESLPVKAILDSGACCNLISENLVGLLGVERQKTDAVISCLNDTSVRVKTQLKTDISNLTVDNIRKIDFLVVPKITGITPSKCLDISALNLPPNITLADPHFHKPGKIDLLLGNEYFCEFLRPGQCRVPNSQLILQNSVFGFLASGRLNVTRNQSSRVIQCKLIANLEDLHKDMTKFWELEKIEKPIKSVEEEKCEKNSKTSALGSLNSLWRRLSKNPELLSLYRDFMQEYEALGHMELVTDNNEPSTSYYLPHHGVFKPDKTSTKLRVVFNASALSSNGLSLNDTQMNGGLTQEDLFSIMLRFRKHKFVFSADIRKMYRMILVDPQQRDLQRIVWKNGENDTVKTYKLNTVTHGTTSAPYLATRVLHQLVKDEGQCFPLAATVLDSDFYMDDVLTGGDSLEEMRELQIQLIRLLSRAGMELHKWRTNASNLRSNISEEKEYSFSCSSETKALGILWDHLTDCFSFKVLPSPQITKRAVSSNIARIFDPLGLLGPVITVAKIFLQRLWKLKIDWNDYLPEREAEEWERFLNSLHSINQLCIPRHVLCEFPEKLEVHGFADASEKAYGAVVYLKSSAGERNCVRLLCSKSRVAPLKSISVPKLELCAAVLLAQLVKRVLCAIKLEINGIYLWSDSTIVLAWIQHEPWELKTFVPNRIAAIQELTKKEQWFHVSSGNNPADVPSRGFAPEKLCNNELWWTGPSFLQADFPVPLSIPNSNDDVYLSELKTSKPVFLTLNAKEKELFIECLLSVTNSYLKLIRVMSFIFRFIFNSRNPHSLRSGPLTDSNGILRVGGRLEYSNLTNNQKHPIVLPKSHRLTKLIFVYFHLKNLHVGPRGLLCAVRQKFWPIHGRNLSRKIVNDCITCFRNKPVLANQIMGNLPAERITPTFPFNVCGVDFIGPLLVKPVAQRRITARKMYVAIFVCFVTKAVHFELVTDLTSEAFIACLKRFFARRGKSSIVYSDNATNFVGAQSELKRSSYMLKKPDENVSAYLASEEIKWKFSPPRSPNFGGLYEAGVKSFKYHFRRVMKNTKVSIEEILTIISQIEGILNSRPLTPLTCDPTDLSVLTAGHFLIGRPITSVVEPEIIDTSDNRLSRWQRTTKVVQFIWKRWHRDYLNHLQQRSKWQFEKNDSKIGSLVLLKEDNLPPCMAQMKKFVLLMFKHNQDYIGEEFLKFAFYQLIIMNNFYFYCFLC